MSRLNLVSCFLFLLSFYAVNAQNIDSQRQWNMFRGYHVSGVLDDANLPEKWDAGTGENIAWKTEIPGLGHSCPIVWGENIFVTTAVSSADKEGVKTGIYGSIGSVIDSSKHEWKIYCIDKRTGKIGWERVAHRGIPEQKRHPMSSHANCTPATNGEFVLAFFGSEGLYCYDMEGNLRWNKNFGLLRSNFFLAENAEWEFASSPLIYDNFAVVQCDVAKNSFIAAYDLQSGEELWKQQRDDYPGWSTPNIYMHNEQPAIAVNGYKHRGGYDFKTGKEIWRMAGGGDIPIPTPIVGNNLIYFNSAHGKASPVLAIKQSATGTIPMPEDESTSEYIKWFKPRGGAYMETMLLYNGYLYNAHWNGKLTCYDAVTGEEMYAEKAGNGNSYTASPVAADGIIYITDNDGNVYSIKAGPNYELLRVNKLNATCMATPAIADNYLFFRTTSHLVAVTKN